MQATTIPETPPASPLKALKGQGQHTPPEELFVPDTPKKPKPEGTPKRCLWILETTLRKQIADLLQAVPEDKHDELDLCLHTAYAQMLTRSTEQEIGAVIETLEAEAGTLPEKERELLTCFKMNLVVLQCTLYFSYSPGEEQEEEEEEEEATPSVPASGRSLALKVLSLVMLVVYAAWIWRVTT